MSAGTRLDGILADVQRGARHRRQRLGVVALRAMARPQPRARERFCAALRSTPLAFIAECKRRSPSAGTLADDGLDLAARARAYAAGGAAALSVLTEEDHFQGSLADLERAQPAGLPRLRKDFLLDEGMVLESAVAGCEAVLLIVACLPDARLAELRLLAGELGLAVLLEVHDESELARAVDVQPECIGVNARDLRTFEVDLGTLERLLPLVPSGFLRVAESGMRSCPDFRRARAAGADAVLVGEALMRAADPEQTLRRWREEMHG